MIRAVFIALLALVAVPAAALDRAPPAQNLGPGSALFGGLVCAPGKTCDVSGMSVLPLNGSRQRSLADRAADTLNVLDFAGTADLAALRAGAVDAAPAFNAAIASRPSGSKVRLIVPAGTYQLATGVTDNGRFVTADLTSGAVVGANFGGSGSGNLYVTRVEYRTQAGVATQTQGSGTAADGYTLANPEYVINNGGAASQGKFFSYENFNTSVSNTNGGDIAHHIIGYWHERGPGSAFLTWDVGITPIVPDSETAASNPRTFAIVGKELNIAHNGPTSGWTEYDSRKVGAGLGAPQWGSIGTQFVPDSWTPTGRRGGHVNIGFGVFPDIAPNNRSPSYINGTYSGFHVGNDAIAPGGRGVYLGGNTDGTASKYASSAVEARYRWPMFLDLSLANLTSGWIVNAVPGQKYRWSTTAGDVTLDANNSGQLVITAPGGVSGPNVPWTSFTPSVGAGSGSPTFGAVTAAYQIFGKRVYLSYSIPITTNGTGAAYIYVGLPPGVQANRDFTLSGNEENNVTSKMLFGRVKTNDYIINILNYDSTYPGATGAVLNISGVIEMK
jgi:hypothetical protein